MLYVLVLQITLRHPEEYLVQVKGTTGKLSFGEGITSLTFVTNEKSYGPYGNPTSDSFESPGGHKVTGFFGRSGMFLDQLGIFCETHTVHRTVEGPWGGVGGASFYDGVGDIVEIVLTYNDTQVVSFQTSYGLAGLGFTTGYRGHDNQTLNKVCLIPPLYLNNYDYIILSTLIRSFPSLVYFPVKAQLYIYIG